MKNLKMLSVNTLLLGLLWANSVQADGFVCEAPGENLKIQVYNRTHREQGTRNAAVMILSDSQKRYGNKTLARFHADNDNLNNRGSTYYATINRSSLSSGERKASIAGLRLAQLQEIVLRIDFRYNKPIKNGAKTTGLLELYRTNGDQLWLDLDCVRYLKSPN